jgi:hypothetical protein
LPSSSAVINTLVGLNEDTVLKEAFNLLDKKPVELFI